MNREDLLNIAKESGISIGCVHYISAWEVEKLFVFADKLIESELKKECKNIRFFRQGKKMAFEIGVQQFTLDYEPEDEDEFKFMRYQLLAAFKKLQPRPNNSWLRACDDALVSAHLGVAKKSDDYKTAVMKLNTLIDWHISVATDPAVNGGFSLQPVKENNEQACKQSESSANTL